MTTVVNGSYRDRALREGSAYIIDEKCIGCGECLVVCNVGAVKMRWDDNAIRVQEKMAEYAYALKMQTSWHYIGTSLLWKK